MTSFAAKTHPGLKRSRNEDCFIADRTLGLWVVADGVGGHTHGDVASRIACDTIQATVAEGESLTASLHQAHLAVLEEIRRRNSADNMGTTAVVLRLRNSEYEVAWVGDSRAYLYDAKSEELLMLTTDHSAVFDLVGRGELTREQARTHPQRHALSRSLGVSDRNASQASVVSGRLKPGQQLLLCSDGLTDELSDTSIAYQLKSAGDLDSQVEKLVDKALLSGGRDNVTVIVIAAADDAPNQSESDATFRAANIVDPPERGRMNQWSKRTILYAVLIALCACGLLAYSNV